MYIYLWLYQDAKRHNAKQFIRWTLMSSTCKGSFLGHAFPQEPPKKGTPCLLLYSHYKAHIYLARLGESKCVTESATAYTALGFSIQLSHFRSTRGAGEQCSAPSLKGKSCSVVDFEDSLHTLTLAMQTLGLLAGGCIKLILGSDHRVR